jgi:tetratricopeptide (TPR) repeat protein
MALRLTTPDAAGAAPAPAPTPVSIAARAGALLHARDLAGFRGLAAQAATIEGFHPRYAARRGLLEAGLAAASSAPAFAAVAAAGVEVLEAEPREPALLTLTGVAFYEAGALAPARRLFEAALRLDDGLVAVARNLEECERRRRAGFAPPAAVAGALRELAPRAERLAAAARPVPGLTLSLCMIVRDEEAMLGRCLAAVRDAVDELVVVDTGSQDRTVEIAEGFGARILHHAWTGDFAAARNVAFDAATGDWLLYLDADEVLVAGDAPRLRALTQRTWREAFFLVETNHTGDLEDGTAVVHDALRVFRNRPEHRFEGRIHEQIAHRLPSLPERLEKTAIRVEHFGYLGTVREAKDKSARNLELLERQVADGVDTPFLHFNLGSELTATGEHERALEHLRRAWEEVSADPALRTYGYAPSLAARFVRALRSTGRLDEVGPAADRALAIFPGLTDVVLEAGHAAHTAGDRAEARRRFEDCLAMGDAPSSMSAVVGCGTFFALAALATLEREEGDLEAAEALLRRGVAEHPAFLGMVEPLAAVLLARGAAPADAAAEVLGLLGEAVTPGARFLLAVPLFEAGAVVEAEGLLRAVLAAKPAVHQARVALAEALLSQGRLDDAAAEAARVPGDAPCAAAAVRTAAFARLAAGQDPGPLDALPADERAAYAAWASGAPAGVPAGAAPAIVTMLDALARLRAFDAFERLAAVLDGLALPWRERRELLAGVLLRRGFDTLAAEQWMAVVDRCGPDRRALRGLAAVARRQGLEDDATLLEAEAAGQAA